MGNRDVFEEAYVAEVGGPTMAWYLRDHRVNDDAYLFESVILTGMLNAAWWAYRKGQSTVLAGAQPEGEAHVVH